MPTSDGTSNTNNENNTSQQQQQQQQAQPYSPTLKSNQGSSSSSSYLTKLKKYISPTQSRREKPNSNSIDYNNSTETSSSSIDTILDSNNNSNNNNMTKNENRNSEQIGNKNSNGSNTNTQPTPKIVVDNAPSDDKLLPNTIPISNRPRRSSSPLSFLSKKFNKKKHGDSDVYRSSASSASSSSTSSQQSTLSPVINTGVLPTIESNTPANSPTSQLDNDLLLNIDQKHGRGHHHHHHHLRHRRSNSLQPQKSSRDELIPSSLAQSQMVGESLSDTDSLNSVNFNQFPHTVIIKILNYMVQSRIYGDKSEFRLEFQTPTSNQEIQPSSSSHSHNNNTNSNNLSTSTSLQQSQSLSSSINPNVKVNPNLDLEVCAMVCKLWAKKITPKVFHHFVVKSSKHLKSLIGLATRGIMNGGRPFTFTYIVMVLDKSSTYQKLLNIAKHAIPDKLPEKFVKATTKPILSNLVSKSLFSSFFDVCTSLEYFRFYQKWASPDNYSAIGAALHTNQSITHLSLRNNSLEDQMISDIIASLHQNNAIKILDLRLNKLGNATAIALGGALLRNKTLTSIDLFYNQIGSEGGVALANALKVNTTVKNLYLGWNKTDGQTAVVLGDSIKSNPNSSLESIVLDRIEDSAAASFFQSLSETNSIREVHFSECRLSEKSSKSLSAILSKNDNCHLTDLILRGNLLGNSVVGLATPLALNTTLTKLSLADNRIGDEAGSQIAKSLRDNSTLTHLSLSFNHLGSLFAEELTQSLLCNSTLLMLDLSNNQIEFEGAQQVIGSLSSNNTLKLLNMCQNKLTSKIGQVVSKSLVGNTALVHLELAYAGLGNEGAVAIAKGLTDNINIRRLNLSENQITDEGGLAIAKSLHTNHHLQVLDLSYNQFTYKTKEEFEKIQKGELPLLQLSLSSVPLPWKFQL